jgi:hypothetical protein
MLGGALASSLTAFAASVLADGARRVSVGSVMARLG